MSLINFIASSVYMCAENCTNFYFCNRLIYRRLKRPQLGGIRDVNYEFTHILSNSEQPRIPMDIFTGKWIQMLTNFAGGDWNVFKLLFLNRWLIVIRRLFFGDGTSLNYDRKQHQEIIIAAHRGDTRFSNQRRFYHLRIASTVSESGRQSR